MIITHNYKLMDHRVLKSVDYQRGKKKTNKQKTKQILDIRFCVLVFSTFKHEDLWDMP